MFSQEERLIFAYRVGAVETRADPDPLYRRMLKNLNGMDLRKAYHYAALERCDDDPPGKEVSDEEQERAIEALVALAEATFGVKRFEHDPKKGLTEGELLGVLADFIRFVSEKKEPAETSPDSSPGDGVSAGTPPTANTSA